MQAMYAAVRHYRTKGGAGEELTRRAEAEFVPRLRKIAGFVAYYVLNPGPDEVVSISIFRDEQGAAESVRSAAEWVRGDAWLTEHSPTPPEVLQGEVLVHAE
jgi:heme-degrading monooxygenase HmoA